MKPDLAQSKVYPLAMFNWVKQERTLTAEASTITRGGRLPMWQRLYSDACDVGFYVEGVNQTVCFYLDESETETDAEGDILTWTFRPIRLKPRQADQFGDLKIIVYND